MPPPAQKPIPSKISPKGQTVLPKEVRERLGTGQADSLHYFIDARGVRIEKAQPPEQDDLFAAFREWATDADEAAYRDL